MHSQSVTCAVKFELATFEIGFVCFLECCRDQISSVQFSLFSVVQLHRIFWHLAQRSSTRCRQFTHPGSLGEHIPATNFSSSKAYFISILWELFEGRTSCMFEVPEGSWCPPVRPLETSSSYQQATGRSFKHQGFWPKRACPSRSKPSGNSPHEVNRLWRWMPTTTEPESSWVRIELHEASSRQSVSDDSPGMVLIHHQHTCTVKTGNRTPGLLLTSVPDRDTYGA